MPRAQAWLGLTLAALVLAPGRAAAADQDLRRIGVAELELSLAKRPDLYLALDPAAKTIEVRARGMVLGSFKLQSVSRLVFRPLFGQAEAPTLRGPAIWTVVEGPGDTDRETIAPTTLRPYSEEAEEEEPVLPDKNKKKDDDGPAEIPSSYRVQLDTGWQLMLVNQEPRLGWARRFVAAVQDGWARVRGQEPSHPPLVTLVVSKQDARQLHHLFRSGMSILVEPGS